MFCERLAFLNFPIIFLSDASIQTRSHSFIYLYSYFFSGIINSLFLGAGCGVGAFLSGFMIDVYGAVTTFRSWALAAFVLLLVFLLSQMARSRCSNIGRADKDYIPINEIEDNADND